MKRNKQFINKESQSLDKYLQEIGKTPLLTAEEEIELAQRIRKGDRLALEALTKANLRFVVSVAKQYQNQGLSLGDLINEGNLGLIKAATRFDETKGYKFISYAVWWIRQSILQAIAEQSRMVRLPLNRVGSINKIAKTFNALEQELERLPDIDEIARELNMDVEEVAYALEISGRHVSIDATFTQAEDASNNLLDVIVNDQQPLPDFSLMKDSLRNEIRNVISNLSEKEAQIIKYYYGIDSENCLTLEEIGERMNLTRERIRQIKEKALRKLRQATQSRSLRAYLG